MKALLEFNGFHKIMDVEKTPVLLKIPFNLNGTNFDMFFHRLGMRIVDGEEVLLYEAIIDMSDLEI